MRVRVVRRLIKGRLDNIAGHRLSLALEALTPRPAPDDDRDPGQRRADALDVLATGVLARPDTKPGGHVPPQITMILTAETWAAARADRQRRRRALAGTGGREDQPRPRTGRPDSPDAAPHWPESPGYLPATLEDGTPVPAGELAAAMCDCRITRLVLDADSAPLDLGRSARLFTGGQRRAVIARDRQCAWPGCAAHARWCQIHHIRWWERDVGPTSTENAVLLCHYHHHEVHRRDLTITRRLPELRNSASASGSGPPRHRLGAPDSIALAAYGFRDPGGRRIGDHATTTTASRRVDYPTADDELALSRTTDRVTGRRIPASRVVPRRR